MGIRMRRLRLFALSLTLAAVALVVVGIVLFQVSLRPVAADPGSVYVDAAGQDRPTCGTVVSPCQTIQYAIDTVAGEGDAVIVAAGTYTEQVEIARAMTLEGAGSGTVIASPVKLTTCFTVTAPNCPIVYVHDVAEVTIQDLVVDGAARGQDNYRFHGIGLHNAGGTVDGVEVRDVRDEPLGDADHGAGLYLYNDDGVARSITVSSCTFSRFQKNGLALQATATTPLAVDVRGNEVQGAGVLTYDDGDPVQNGIQVSAELGTGTVADNTVRGIAYDNTNAPTKYVASSILNVGADLDIRDNRVSDGHVGVYSFDGAGQIRDNALAVDKVGVSAFGIIISDPPYAVPSPFGEESAGVRGLGGASPEASTLDVAVSGNAIFLSGAVPTDTCGIEAYAGYGPDDIALTLQGNTVTGFGVGIEVRACQSGCSTGVFDSVEANYNRISGNTVGLRSNVDTLLVDAMDNWWGCNEGPNEEGCDTIAGTGMVDANPWLVLRLAADPTLLVVDSGPSLLTADLRYNSRGLDTSALGHIPDGVTTTFSAILGTVTPEITGTVGGLATSRFTAGSTPGSAVVSATVDSETVTTTIAVDRVELVVDKTDGVVAARAGDVLTYTLTITNDSSLDATGIVITDTLPVSTTYVGGADWHQVGDLGVYTQSIAGLGARQSTTLSLSVRLDETVPAGFGPITNTAQVADDGSSGPRAFASDSDVDGVIVPPDLVLAKENGVESARPGQVLTYTLTVSNAGRQDATGVVLTDTLPAHSVLVTATGTFDSSNGVVTWAPFDLSAGGSTTRTVAVQLADPPWPGGVEVITNTAVVADDGAYGADLHVTDNQAVDVDGVDASPNLMILKDDGETSAELGEVTAYILSYVNQGDQVAKGVVITETVPDQTTFEAGASTPGWQQVGTTNVYTLAVGILEPGSGDLAIFAVRVNHTLAAGVSTIENLAAIGDDGTSGEDARPGNNVASDVNAVSGEPDLAVDKDDGLLSVDPAVFVTYTLTIGNVGTQGATGVVVRDTLPAHTSFITASHGGTLSAGVVTWPAFSLAAPGSTTRTLTIQLPAAIPAGVEVITNAVSVADDGENGEDLNAENNTAVDVNRVEAVPIAALVKSDGRGEVAPGDIVTYTLTVKNVGQQGADALVLSDTLPAHTSFVAASDGGVLVDGVVVWQDIALAVGAETERTVTVQVDQAVPPGVETITNRAEVTGPEGVYDSDDDVDALVLTSDLVVTKDDGQASVAAGQAVTYTLTIRNAGTVEATGIVLSDTLPAETVFIAASNGGDETSPSSGVVTWPPFALLAGQSVKRTVAVRVLDAIPAGVEAITNTTSVADDGTYGPDVDPADNTAQDVDLVAAAPVLSVAKDDGRGRVAPGDVLTYTLTVRNTGSQDAAAVIVTDTLPAHTEFVGASAGYTFEPIAGTVSWPAFALGAGDLVTRTVTVELDDALPSGVDAITNTAVAVGDGGVSASAEDVDEVAAGPDLRVLKTDGRAGARPGEILTYTLTVENLGTRGATGVALSDTLPASALFADASGGGSEDGGVVTWPPFALSVGAIVTRTVTVELEDALPSGVDAITNTAVAVGDGGLSAGAEDVDEVAAGPDLRVLKTDGRAGARPGEILTYTLTVENLGTRGATGVALNDTLPASALFADASGGGSEDGGVVTWPLFSLSVEAMVTRTVTVEVVEPWPAGAPAVLRNTVSVVDDGANGADLLPSDNTAVDITRVWSHAVYLPLVTKR